MYDNEWTLDVKVKDPISLVEYDDSFKGSAWKWQVVLESTTDPTYKSYTEKLESGVESTY